ncbi:hypothetical protein [Bacillus sp. FJAT-52991]|uniref:WYL domain-containing protein n=1 Tax=Bacillus kandeliae TaxID=3129297 RepID=A0ABZ2N2B0_9BACI
MKGLLLNSKENRVPLRMFYMNDRNKITERIITVIDFNDELIRAYCHWRKQPRTFKRQNILSVGFIRQRRRGA